MEIMKAVGTMFFTLAVLIGIVTISVWLVMADLSQVMNRFLNWTQKGTNYWLVLFPLVISGASILFLTEYRWGLDAFRMIGIVIEVMGLLTVVWSLSKESKKYNHIGYHKSFFDWACEVTDIFKPSSGFVGVASMTGGASICSGSLTVSLPVFKNIDEKVEYLMGRIVELQTSIDNNNNLIVQVRKDLSGKIDEFNVALNEQIKVLKDELRDKATLDYYLLISGSWLTTIGMIITNTPDNVFVYAFKFQVK